MRRCAAWAVSTASSLTTAARRSKASHSAPQTVGGDAVESASDAKGKWVLAGIGRGEWLVTVLKPGFAAKRLKITVEREIDRSQEIKITLAKG